MGRGRVLGGGASSGVDHNLSQGPCRVIAPAGEISGLSCFPGFRLDHTGPNSLSWPGTEGQHPQVKGKRASVPARLARPSSLLSSPPPLLAPFSSALREGGGAGCMCMYVCMYACVRAPVCVCVRVCPSVCVQGLGVRCMF